MPTPNSATIVSREAAWLQTSGDGLPALLSSADGPFDVVQAYRARTPRARGACLYVVRKNIDDQRFANIRKQAKHAIGLQIVWPLSSGLGSAEADQQALDDAVELVLQRVSGPLVDKTHGGRFLSVAEVPRWLQVDFVDPATTIAAKAGFEAEVLYFVDDFDTPG